MAEQVHHSKTTNVFDFLKETQEINVMLAVLTSLVRGKDSIGLTEDNLVDASNLKRDNVLREVKKLEKDNLVYSFLCQESTAGPYARRYKLVDGIEIKLEITRPTKSTN